MSHVNTILWLAKDTGERVALIPDFVSLTHSPVLGGVGTMSLELPGSFDWSLLRKHWRVEVWSGESGQTPTLERSYLIVYRGRKQGASGQKSITVQGVDAHWILSTRIVAYAAGSAQASQTDYADDLMKAVVSQNQGSSATDAARRLDTYITVDGDLSKGPSITKEFSRDNVLDVLQDLQKASAVTGPTVYWGLIEHGVGWRFVTSTGAFGRDRRFYIGAAGQSGVLFSQVLGNLVEPEYEEDWRDEVTYVYAGGSGEKADRKVRTASSEDRIAESVFGRVEGWTEDSNEDNLTALDDLARRELIAGMPKRRFAARILDTDRTRYLRDWRVGDIVTIREEGANYNCLVRSATIEVDRDGRRVSADAEELV